jgi:hypothetical protein
MKHRQILIGKQKESITPQTQHKQWTWGAARWCMMLSMGS